MSTKADQTARKGQDIKFSPSSFCPTTYQLFCVDDDFSNSRFNPPMKLKDPHGTLHISSADNSFPASPFLCQSPYYGSFGVSATPQSGRTSASSPSLNPSPQSRSHTEPEPRSATSYHSANQAPIPIAPNPLTFQRGAKVAAEQYTFQHNVSSKSAQHTGPPRRAFPETGRPYPAKSKRNHKKKGPTTAVQNDILSSQELNSEEQILIQLTCRDNLQWKEVAAKFNKATGKNMKVAALQMRKKRLMERLRVWKKEEVVDSALLPEVFTKLC